MDLQMWWIGEHSRLVDAVELVDCRHDNGPADMERKDGVV